MARRGGRGRPTKLTPDVQKRITDGIRLGMTLEHAANFGGISYYTLTKWRKRGEEQKSGIYRDFVEALEEANGQAVAALLAKVQKAANNDDWRAATWILERRWPEDYGKQVQQVQGPDGGPAGVVIYLPDNGRGDR